MLAHKFVVISYTLWVVMSNFIEVVYICMQSGSTMLASGDFTGQSNSRQGRSSSTGTIEINMKEIVCKDGKTIMVIKLC